MKTLNDWVAVTPFPEHEVKSVVRRGVALIEQTIQLTKLTVLTDAHAVDGSHLFQKGNVVYVRGEAMKHQWSTEVMKMEDGTPFILIPKSIIVAANEK